VADQASEIMGKWEDEIIGRAVNGMMSSKREENTSSLPILKAFL